jgi:hypothetical protein
MPPVPASVRPTYFRPSAPPERAQWVFSDAVNLGLGLPDQKGDNWCWAATTALATKMTATNGDALSQTQVAELFYQGTATANPAAVSTMPLSEAWNKAGLNALVVAEPDLSNPPYRNRIIECSNSPFPVGITIKWEGQNSGHALCVFGAGTIDGEPAVAVYDPVVGGDHDNIVQLPISALDHYYSGPVDGLFGRWVEALVYKGRLP